MCSYRMRCVSRTHHHEINSGLDEGKDALNCPPGMKMLLLELSKLLLHQLIGWRGVSWVLLEQPRSGTGVAKPLIGEKLSIQPKR